MKKIFLVLLLTFLAISTLFSQGGPPEPPTGCEFCEELLTDGASNEEYTNCIEINGCESTIPINSNILILFTLAISFGTYSIYKTNKKRRSEI